MELSQIIDEYMDSLKAMGTIRSAAVEAAFRKVQRHRFIEQVYQKKDNFLKIDPSNPEHLAMVYSDKALLTRTSPPSSSSQPSLMAGMLEDLQLKPGMRVLEIGAGTGYNAALMAEIVSDPALITTIDIQEDVVAQTRGRLVAAGYGDIHVLAQDGFFGCPEHAPYDRIIATVGCPDLSPHWVAQLVPDGLMLIPLVHGDASSDPVICVTRDNERIWGQVVRYSCFMPFRGEFWQDLWLSQDDCEKRIVAPLLKGIKPDAEYPLFGGFKEWSARIEFFYFLALHTRHSFVCWKGVGIADGASFVLLDEDSIKVYGTLAPALYEGIKSMYQQWEELGKPLMLDYESEFLPLSEDNQRRQDFEPNTWIIDRKAFRQVVRLPHR